MVTRQHCRTQEEFHTLVLEMIDALVLPMELEIKAKQIWQMQKNL